MLRRGRQAARAGPAGPPRRRRGPLLQRRGSASFSRPRGSADLARTAASAPAALSARSGPARETSASSTSPRSQGSTFRSLRSTPISATCASFLVADPGINPAARRATARRSGPATPPGTDCRHGKGDTMKRTACPPAPGLDVLWHPRPRHGPGSGQAPPAAPAAGVRPGGGHRGVPGPPDAAEQRANSDAYFEGGYWLILWGFLCGLGVACAPPGHRPLGPDARRWPSAGRASGRSRSSSTALALHPPDHAPHLPARPSTGLLPRAPVRAGEPDLRRLAGRPAQGAGRGAAPRRPRGGGALRGLPAGAPHLVVWGSGGLLVASWWSAC